jgi:hypothetical protein
MLTRGVIRSVQRVPTAARGFRSSAKAQGKCFLQCKTGLSLGSREPLASFVPLGLALYVEVKVP